MQHEAQSCPAATGEVDICTCGALYRLCLQPSHPADSLAEVDDFATSAPVHASIHLCYLPSQMVLR